MVLLRYLRFELCKYVTNSESKYGDWYQQNKGNDSFTLEQETRLNIFSSTVKQWITLGITHLTKWWLALIYDFPWRFHLCSEKYLILSCSVISFIFWQIQELFEFFPRRFYNIYCTNTIHTLVQIRVCSGWGQVLWILLFLWKYPKNHSRNSITFHSLWYCNLQCCKFSVFLFNFPHFFSV